MFDITIIIDCHCLARHVHVVHGIDSNSLALMSEDIEELALLSWSTKHIWVTPWRHSQAWSMLVFSSEQLCHSCQAVRQNDDHKILLNIDFQYYQGFLGDITYYTLKSTYIYHVNNLLDQLRIIYWLRYSYMDIHFFPYFHIRTSNLSAKCYIICTFSHYLFLETEPNHHNSSSSIEPAVCS